MTESLPPEELARALRDLNAWALAHAPAEESPLRVRIREHLGTDPAELPVVSNELPPWERANLQVALDAYLAEEGRSHDFVGLSPQHGWHMGLAELAQRVGCTNTISLQIRGCLKGRSNTRLSERERDRRGRATRRSTSELFGVT